MPYVVALQKYTDFSGPATRTEFWLWFLIHFSILIGIAIVTNIVQKPFGVLPGTLFLLYGLATLIPHLAVTARRLHDTGRSGWWILVSLVPFFGFIILLILLMLGSDDDNEYGPRPV